LNSKYEKVTAKINPEEIANPNEYKWSLINPDFDSSGLILSISCLNRYRSQLASEIVLAMIRGMNDTWMMTPITATNKFRDKNNVPIQKKDLCLKMNN